MKKTETGSMKFQQEENNVRQKDIKRWKKTKNVARQANGYCSADT